MKDELRRLKSLAGPFPAFDMGDVPDDPQSLFAVWLRDAIAAGVEEPHAMVLSTVDHEGAPDARVLILKNLDDRGWHFATGGNSPKARQMAVRPRAALTFYWTLLGRQVRIRGTVVAAPAEERDADFRARSAEARAIALTGRQSEELASAREFEEVFEQQRNELAATPDLIASNWALLIVEPDEVEFWQGSSERRHGRLRYRRGETGWQRALLWP